MHEKFSDAWILAQLKFLPALVGFCRECQKELGVVDNNDSKLCRVCEDKETHP